MDIQLADAKEALEKHREQYAEVDRDITLILGELQKLAAKRQHLRWDPVLESLLPA